MYRILTITFITVLATACGGKNTQVAKPSIPAPPSIKKEAPTTKAKKQTSGGYYLDDGPDDNPPKNLDGIPDATPKHEAINVASTRPYQALGKTYVPMKTRQAFRQSGKASWYGKHFHGRKTANGERYDMYAMTAAHKTLPLPSYVRITNPANKKSVVVRVNDRGPFKSNRIVDLSYAAAHRLNIIEQGSAPVTLEVVNPSRTLAHRQVKQANKPKPQQRPLQNPPIKKVQVQKQPQQRQVITNNKLDGYYVQVAAFRSQANLASLKQKIVDAAITTREMVYHVYNGDLYKLRLGSYASKAEATAAATMLNQKLSLSPIINRNKK